MRGSEGHGAALAMALKDLILQWEQTAPVWRDQARVDFEREYVQELVPAVRQAAGAIQQIEEILRQIRKECS